MLIHIHMMLFDINYHLHPVTTYNNVREAMSFLYGNKQTVDLIICDVCFPTEDGLLILQEVTSKFDIPTVGKFLYLYSN